MQQSDMIPATPPRRLRNIAWVLIALALLVAVGVGVYGLVSPSHPAATPATPSPTPETTSSTTSPASSGERFARQVASTLFDWDTMIDTPAAITQRLTAEADPAGDETPGLVADIGMYLPSPDIWDRLQQYQTSQHLDIDSVVIPDSWAGIVASTPPGQLPAGAVAYTITGTRHRDGVVDGQPETATRPVSFTIFITCSSSGQCFLLRLSIPDTPLQ